MRNTADFADSAFHSRVTAFLVQNTVLASNIVNAVHTFTESEHKATAVLIETAGKPMEQASHAKTQFLRQKIRELRSLLAPVLQSASSPPFPFPKESPST